MSTQTETQTTTTQANANIAATAPATVAPGANDQVDANKALQAQLDAAKAALAAREAEVGTLTAALDQVKTKLTTEVEGKAALEARLTSYQEAETQRFEAAFAGLPDDEKALVTSLGGDDKAAQLRALDALKSAGKIGAPAQVTPAEPPAAQQARTGPINQTRLGSKEKPVLEPPKTKQEAAERTALAIQEAVKKAAGQS